MLTCSTRFLSRTVWMTGLPALALLAGCDRQSDAPVQPPQQTAQQTAAPGQASGSAAGEQLTGTLDRSFAGQPMPVAVLTDPAGDKLALDQTRGRPTLLNLWATWCAPCVVEMPLLDTLAGDLGDEVRVLTVSEDLEGAEAVKPFFAQKQFANLPPWMDPESDLAFAFGGGSGLPLTVLYDSEGREVWRVIGGYDWSSPEARAAIAEAVS